MARAEQIDKATKLYCSKKSYKDVKKEHHRNLRREAKDPHKPHPQYNRYNGWVL